MRRLIHNTTAIAACLSLIAPHLAVAQNAEQQLRLAQSEGQPENPADELLKKQRAEEKARKQAERAAAKEAARQEAAQQEEQPKKRQRDEERPEQAERKKAEERPERAERQREEERPEPAKREQAEERPKQAERQREEERPEPAKREKAEQRPKKAERQAEEEAREPAAGEAAEPRREKAARQEDESRPERAERVKSEERPQAAERSQEQERPKPRKAEAEDAPEKTREERKPKGEAKQDAGDRPSEDDLSKALAAEEAARDGKAEPRKDAEARKEALPRKEAERKEAEREEAKPADGGKRSEDRPAKRDDSDLAKALAAEEAGRKATRAEDRKAEEDRPRKAREDREAAEKDRDADQDRVERARRENGQDDQDRPRDRAERREREETDGERRAARETRADTSAAALREDRRGEISEERVTRANSRSSSEDFDTNLRDAMDERDDRRREREAEARRDDDDDKKDLAKALLLGLGAVAVGSMLANNSQVALSSPDRLVVTRPDGSQELIKDDVALLRQPGSTVTTENFDDGSSRTIVTRADGSKVVTIRDADLRVLRRSLVSPDGRVTQLIDDTQEVAPVDIASLPRPVSRPYTGSITDEDALREALRREVDVDRRFTLGQIRNIPEVRSLVSPINIDAITFESGSAAISPDQASQLSGLGHVIQDAIAENPQEMFLIEGHTDAVGRDAMNLALSDRRAESVALALSEYYDVPAENLVVQGYGEQFLQVQTEGDERENRRAAVRRITDLLQTAEAQ